MALSDNLSAHWAFDDTNWLDETANNNDLTAGGTPTNGTGILSNSVNLVPASSEVLSIADGSDTGLTFGANDWFINVWVKFDDLSANRPIVTKWASGAGNAGLYFFYRVAGTAIRANLYDSTGVIATLDFSETIVTGEWYNIQLWHDDSAEFLFGRINGGITQRNGYSGQTPNDPAVPFEIGGNASAGEYFSGDIDEVSFWTRNPTPREQDWLYNYGRARSYTDITTGITNSTLGGKVVAAWEMNEASGVRYDYLGTENLTDNNTVTQAAGRVNKAASCLDANSEYLSRANSTALQTGDQDYTICGWFRCTDVSATRNMFNRWENSAGKKEFVSQVTTGSKVLTSIWDGSNLEAVVTSTSSITLNAWHFYTVTYNATTELLTVYLDNSSEGTDTATTSPAAGTSPTYFGNGNTGDQFNGDLCSWAKFSGVLSSDEITFLPSCTTQASDAGCRKSWTWTRTM
jgi:hypothetical protein